MFGTDLVNPLLAASLDCNTLALLLAGAVFAAVVMNNRSRGMFGTWFLLVGFGLLFIAVDLTDAIRGGLMFDTNDNLVFRDPPNTYSFILSIVFVAVFALMTLASIQERRFLEAGALAVAGLAMMVIYVSTAAFWLGIQDSWFDNHVHILNILWDVLAVTGGLIYPVFVIVVILARGYKRTQQQKTIETFGPPAEETSVS